MLNVNHTPTAATPVREVNASKEPSREESPRGHKADQVLMDTMHTVPEAAQAELNSNAAAGGAFTNHMRKPDDVAMKRARGKSPESSQFLVGTPKDATPASIAGFDATTNNARQFEED